MTTSEHTSSDVFAKRCMDISNVTGYFIDPFGVVTQQAFELTNNLKPVTIETNAHEEAPF